MTLLAFQLAGGPPSPEAQMSAQINDLREETKNSAGYFLHMFKNGLDAEALSKLGDEYLKYSKPEQAQICFKASLKLSRFAPGTESPINSLRSR